MKFNKIIILIIICFLPNLNIKAQILPTEDLLKTISCAYKKYYTNYNNFRQTNNTGVNYDIKYHRLRFDIDPGNRYISGSVTTYFLITQNNTSQLTFDFSDTLIIDSVVINNNTQIFNQNNDVLTIDLPLVLNQNDFDSLSIFYHGEPRLSDNRSFVQEYHDTIPPVPVIWTLSEPYGAKEWWPCKQSLSDKIDSIDIIVTSPAQYRTASNGLLISDTVNNGFRTCHWKHKHPITAYLVAFATTNYTSFSNWVAFSATDSLEILNYVYPEDSASWAGASTKIIDIMQLFNNMFIDYPFKNEKYGHAQFNWPGGMEHQTMSFMYELSFYLMSHELAHQWFGDYITCRSWQDIWLNEGFATYVGGSLAYEYLLNGYYYPFWKTEVLKIITNLPDGSVFCTDTTNTSRIFDNRLSYYKASYLLHMLRWELGDSAFFAGINNYLTDTLLANAYAGTNDLIRHLELSADTTLTEFFNDWFYGEGFPYYTIMWQQNTDSTVNITIEQTPSHPSVSFYEMKIPLQFWTNSTDTIITFKHQFSGETFNFKIPFIIDSIVFDPEKWIITKNPLIENIKEITNTEYKLLIFPNPVKNKLEISIPSKLNVKNIVIMDITGKQIMIIDKITNNMEIDMSGIKQGCYFVNIYTDIGKISKKIVKY